MFVLASGTHMGSETSGPIHGASSARAGTGAHGRDRPKSWRDTPD